MPRGRPKPPGACERTGCYEIAAASVRIWHENKTFGYRSSSTELCARHASAYAYQPHEMRQSANGSAISWHDGARRPGD